MRWRRFLTLLATLCSLFQISAARAAASGDNDFHRNENWPAPSFQAHVDSRPDGVYVQITARQTVPGTDSPPASQTGNSAPSSAPPSQPAPALDSTRSWYDPARGYFSESPDGHVTSLVGLPISNEAAAPNGWYDVGSQQHPNSSPMVLSVDGNFQGITWVPDTNPADVHFGPPPAAPPDTPRIGHGGTDPHEVALDVLAHIPLPNVQLKVNPGLGLVSLHEWFWIDGYDGGSFGASRTVTLPPPAPGLPPTSFTVTVRVWASEYDWSFGDGETLVTQSVGKPYPSESDIQHMYQHSSFPYADGFPLRMTIQYRAEFRVNGGAPQPLPPIIHTYQTTHLVQEIQSILDVPRKP